MISFAVQQEIYQLRQLIYARGEPVKFIERTTLAGSNPAPNHPTVENLEVNGATIAGSSSISFRAAILTGRLISGDQFVIAGDSTIYTVSAQAISPPTADVVSGVTFTPNLAHNAADGAAVTLTPVAVVNVPMALVTHYPPTAVNGGSILQTDRRVRVLASDLGSWVPLPGSQAVLTESESSVTYQILAVKTVRDQGQIYAYFMQLRR